MARAAASAGQHGRHRRPQRPTARRPRPPGRVEPARPRPAPRASHDKLEPATPSGPTAARDQLRARSPTRVEAAPAGAGRLRAVRDRRRLAARRPRPPARPARSPLGRGGRRLRARRRPARLRDRQAPPRPHHRRGRPAKPRRRYPRGPEQGLQQARRQLPTVIQAKHDAEQSLAERQARLEDVGRRRWGRHDRDSDRQAQTPRSPSPRNDWSRRSAPSATSGTVSLPSPSIRSIVARRSPTARPRRKELDSTLAQIDAALERTRPERVRALADDPPPTWSA